MIDNRLLKIASNTRFYGLKNVYTYKTNLKNSICGDKISMEISLKKNTIKELRYETEACIFCQASAIILSNVIKSIHEKDLKKEIEIVYKSFNNGKIKLPKKYYLFKPLINKKYKNRTNCILLPFNAILKALRI